MAAHIWAGMAEDDGVDLASGPAMQALTERQRRFVLAMSADPFAAGGTWSKAAGYQNSDHGHTDYASRLVQMPGIQRAIEEVARATLGVYGPILAARGLLKIAANPEHPQHFKALEAIANRVGMHEKSEHRITVERSDDGRLRELAERLARELGVDKRKLLGGNEIEGECVEVKGE